MEETKMTHYIYIIVWGKKSCTMTEVDNTVVIGRSSLST
jgi:hypothetical protein